MGNLNRKHFDELNIFEKQEVFVYFVNRLLEPFNLFLSSIGLTMIDRVKNQSFYLGDHDLALNFLKFEPNVFDSISEMTESDFIGVITGSFYFTPQSLIKPNVSLIKQLKPNSRSFAMSVREIIMSNPREYFELYQVPEEIGILLPSILENAFELSIHKLDTVSTIEKDCVSSKLNGVLICKWLNLKPSLELGNLMDSYKMYKGVFMNEFICYNTSETVKKDFTNYVKTLTK